MAGFELFLGQLFEHSDEPLGTPFEEWCRRHDIHPEAWGAWERFEADRGSRHIAG
ncbi:hypothetical protein [Nocardioides dongkuii]|uniref:hypothetical protein n=1 Tax=Nocardioides dongkuii TaxID=2760089 RepID=UPI0015F7B090|nr:hypothetical protein [Nocardioides dongkuii]